MRYVAVMMMIWRWWWCVNQGTIAPNLPRRGLHSDGGSSARSRDRALPRPREEGRTQDLHSDDGREELGRKRCGDTSSIRIEGKFSVTLHRHCYDLRLRLVTQRCNASRRRWSGWHIFLVDLCEWGWGGWVAWQSFVKDEILDSSEVVSKAVDFARFFPGRGKCIVTLRYIPRNWPLLWKVTGTV